MTSHVARLYSLVAGVFAFFVLWATVAAHPWSTASSATKSSSAAALAARERQIALESRRVKLIVDRRWAAYRKALATRNASSRSLASSQIAPAPSVRVVKLPPLVVTRTS